MKNSNKSQKINKRTNSTDTTKNNIRIKNINQRNSNDNLDDFIFGNISDISLDNTLSLSFLDSTSKNNSNLYNKTQNLFYKKDSQKNEYNNCNNILEGKKIKPFTEKQIKALISYYLYTYDLNNKIKKSKLSNSIDSSECYLINESWMNEYKKF